MAYTAQTRAALVTHIQEQGLGNIVFHEVLGKDGPNSFALMCAVCCYQVQWAFNPVETFGIELELITSFCKNHLHGKKPFPKLSEPIIDYEDDSTHLTASDIKKAVDMIIHPKMKEDIEAEGDPFNLLGDIKYQIGKAGMVTAISSSSIKWVARKSNFNVDLQCKVGKKGPEYRAVCEKCNGSLELTHEAVLATDKGIFSGALQGFLAEHRHDGLERESFGGRKFRHTG